jgi:hypothetical protein
LDPSALARFATSCGAFAPLSIAIEYHDGVVATTGTLAQPFAIVGRDPACDIALDSLDLLPCTAFLQVIGGQVFVGDLGTPAGVRWHHGRHPFGWMHPLEPILIGPFALRLLQPVSPHPAPFGATFHPLVPGPDMPLGLPPVEVAFRTGQADRDRWPVNRVLTTIGSASDCKIHLGGDDVAPRHAYLLHTPDGLWAVDLTGRAAIRVNGHATRFALLGEGDELQIGRFVMGINYPFPGEDDGLISFDEVPRPAPKISDQDSATHSGHRPLDPPPSTRRPPRTDFDVEVPPPALHEPAPADWSVEDDTDQIHRPGPRPLSAEEFALLVPVDDRGVADSGGADLSGNVSSR